MRMVGAGLAVVIGLALLCAMVAPARAQNAAGDDGAFRAQLAAGEFASARDLARRLPPAKRDLWLGQIAEAQQRAGSWDASLQSAAEIGDDRARTQTLSRLSSEPLGASGGGSQADFDSLIDLIKQTVKPTSWDDSGGVGTISSYTNGVAIDSRGVLKALLREDAGDDLAALRAASFQAATANRNVRCSSDLRKISLPRLEKQIQLLQAAGRAIPEEMLALAGLQRIQYVLVYPELGDLVLAGPAGDWAVSPEGIVVGRESGRPIVLLDDLVVIFRHTLREPDARFGCLITPRQEGLARLQAYLKKPAPTFSSVQQRRQWANDLREQLGRQDIEVYGLDPQTRAAHVMVEADYRMKLIGMGLEKGVPGVRSYLATIDVPQRLSVLRWWFTLDYQAVTTVQDRQAFAFQGQGVKVESENERLAAEGKRVHTGESEELNRRFARSFTAHFEELAQKYPIYAELRNLCDLALVGALLREENLPEKTGWHLTLFGDPRAFPVMLGPAPKEVDSVVNFRVIEDPYGRRVYTVAGVSGGVAVRPSSALQGDAIRIETDHSLSDRLLQAKPSSQADGRWWWD